MGELLKKAASSENFSCGQRHPDLRQNHAKKPAFLPPYGLLDPFRRLRGSKGLKRECLDAMTNRIIIIRKYFWGWTISQAKKSTSSHNHLQRADRCLSKTTWFLHPKNFRWGTAPTWNRFPRGTISSKNLWPPILALQQTPTIKYLLRPKNKLKKSPEITPQSESLEPAYWTSQRVPLGIRERGLRWRSQAWVLACTMTLSKFYRSAWTLCWNLSSVRCSPTLLMPISLSRWSSSSPRCKRDSKGPRKVRQPRRCGQRGLNRWTRSSR